jgi:hypothetical protein
VVLDNLIYKDDYKDDPPYQLFLLFIVVIAIPLLLNKYGIGNDIVSILE